MKISTLIWMLTGLAVATGTADAQSLAEVARAEQARRKAIKTPAKVYTADDLRRYPAATVVAPPRTDAAAPTVDGAAAASGDASGAGQAAGPPRAAAEPSEETWRARITEARAQLERTRTFLEAMQSRINALTNDFSARDDPIQRADLWNQRIKALETLGQLEKELKDHTAAIAQIEEDARRAGVPPGWLR